MKWLRCLRIRKRTLLVFLSLLIAGAIINVAVAWGCTVFSPLTDISSPSNLRSKDIEWLAARGWRQLPDTSDFTYPVRTIEYAGRGLRFRWMEESREVREHSEHWFISYIVPNWAFFEATEAGWPILSLEGHRVLEQSLHHGDVGGGIFFCSRFTRFPFLVGEVRSDGAVPITKWLDKYPWLDGRLIPLRLLWPGFAINAVFYAALLWTLFAAPRALRRKRRLMRGQCPACGYDLRGSASDSQVCPECGKPIGPNALGSSGERRQGDSGPFDRSCVNQR